MKKLIVNGNTRLRGTIDISGAKNASLPILMSTILFKKPVVLSNVPNVMDIRTSMMLLENLGATIEKIDKNEYKIDCSTINSFMAPYEIVKQMRASFLVLGSLLGRFGKAKVSLPGGCSIGPRPVDIHINAIKQMDVDITMENGYVNAFCNTNGKLQGADINLRFPSVGATQNIIMAGVLANGRTKIHNYAKEPEVVDLINFLNKAGAKISGVGTDTLIIDGVEELNSIEYSIMGDRIEAGTYMIGALMTNGDLTLNGLDFYENLAYLIELLEEIGAEIEQISDNSIRIKRGNKKLKPINIQTAVYPGFPTDLQAQMVSLLSMINGESIVDETIFENRFMHVAELNRMGANIDVGADNKAFIHGKDDCFQGANVMATDLRGGMALILAGLTAKEGQTILDRYYHVDRGYEDLVEKLTNCGANLFLINDENGD